ncbi:GMC family oxidoreductase [Cyanobium sp. HWJ4-Hawea]|uniref:GMC oxidoreductase n=1 Tax=Cyanobium sp. HWJ4-Hawea TaxID=2823713 RepID=UPI0020CFB60E|nr:GMC family oxidoreductase [Cyanobium sp. HWJ4-Hawea]MCP9810201.1 GMC family oxidoreductase [Cyanobium sp. HWJ4-Hawea]
MIIDDISYDVIVVGSGAAGGTFVAQLVGSGLKVLLLERGGQMPAEDQNVADVGLFRKDRYHPKEQWFGTDGDPFSPQAIYALGGNTKIWGGVLERMREREFGGLALQASHAPAWGLTYDDLAPWYWQAEARYCVHGRAGIDPTEPARSHDFAQAPKPIEPFMEELRSALQRHGTNPYDLPISWSDSPQDPSGDAELFGVDLARSGPGSQGQDGAITIRTGADVRSLHVNPSGNEVRGVEALIDGQSWLFQGHQVVLAAGAINTAAILLRSASDQHPRGLANGSDQVGRNLMHPQLTSIIQLAAKPNNGRYPRSLGVNDYLWGDKNVSFPLGSIQNGGGVLQDALFAESPPVLSLVTKLLPNMGLEQLAARSVTWWALSPVLPDRHNRVSLRGDRIQLNYVHNNREAHDRLIYRWIDTLKEVEADPLTHVVSAAPTHPRGEAPLSAVGYACGTCRMGDNPATAVVGLDGRCHELANLTIADASLFPSCPAVGPGLTVIANAMRIAESLKASLFNS